MRDNYQPIVYKYTSTKAYHDMFPVAYRQYKADTHCNLIHGYSFSFTFYFGCDTLDARDWCQDYSSFKNLKKFLEEQFDHTLLVSETEPNLDWYKEAERRKMAKLTILPKLGCESIADMLYKYVNGLYIPENFGQYDSERIWCYRVEVRETQSNMAFREGHREWNEDLFEDFL